MYDELSTYSHTNLSLPLPAALGLAEILCIAGDEAVDDAGDVTADSCC